MTDFAALNAAMQRDLPVCVESYPCTRGTEDFPEGLSIRLRTGEVLSRRELEYGANQHSWNRYKRWLPTEAGISALEHFIEEHR